MKPSNRALPARLNACFLPGAMINCLHPYTKADVTTVVYGLSCCLLSCQGVVNFTHHVNLLGIATMASLNQARFLDHGAQFIVP